jgi:TRAP-type C4-dicarboxylate transport system permease small subunit
LVDRFIRLIAVIALAVSGVCVFVIVALGSADTAGRVFFNNPILGVVEMTETLLAMTIFLGLAYSQKRREHVSVDLLTSRLGPRSHRVATIASLLLTFGVFCFLAWRSSEMAVQAWKVKEVSAGYVRVPVYLAKVSATVGLSAAALECFRQLVWFAVGRDVVAENAARERRIDELAAGTK